MSRPDRCRSAFVCLGLLVCVGAASAAASGSARSPWTLDDIVSQEELGETALRADGSAAAFTVARWQPDGAGDRSEGDTARRTHMLYLVALDDLAAGGKAAARPLTHGGERIGAIAFSPDGSRLAFLSDRRPPGSAEGREKSQGAQLWLLPLAGGEARALTRFARDVKAFDWIDDATLLVAREESASGLERRRKRQDDTAKAVDDPLEAPPVRLWRVPVDGAPQRLTRDDDWIEAFDVDPSGSRAVVYAGSSLSWVFDARVPPAAWIVDLESGERRPMDLAGSRRAGGFRWAPDGDSVWFVQQHSNHTVYRSAAIGRAVRWDAESGRAEVLDVDWSRGVGAPWPVAGGALAVLDDGVFSRPALLLADGGRRDLRVGRSGEDLRFAHRIRAASADGRTLLLEVSAGDRPVQLLAARLDVGGTTVETVLQLSELNEGLADKPLPKVEVVHFVGAAGDEVEGLLHYPVDWRQGSAPAPLVLAPHGGPAGHDRHQWDLRTAYPNLLWQQRGAFVLEVNYHGSDGYGLDWVESIEQRYYELEIPDLEAGVDHVIARGLADPERLAVAGWSNGGILAAKLITVTDRYKAAIIGAADVEWISDWANVDFGAAFDNYYFGGPPWERRDHYLEKSPFFQLPDVITPVLVHTGTEDRAVPPHQSWSIFRVLQQVGKTDVRLLLYPGEGHGLRQRGHQRRKIEEDVAWLERYLFATPDLTEKRRSAVADGSPLAARLARAEANRSGGVFGHQIDGVLVPELVPVQVGDAALEVGRFEVTRAQWAAFDPSFQVDPGAGDLPVTDIRFVDARRYAAWLAERLGRPVRLPTVAEADTLAGDGVGGNTLDRWLGYAATPDDAETLRELLEARGVSLLETVGSSTPHRSHDGAPAVFDLGGNAAEWAVGEDGGGQARGPSAERSSDERTEPSPAYLGLRVVAEPAAESQ